MFSARFKLKGISGGLFTEKEPWSVTKPGFSTSPLTKTLIGLYLRIDTSTDGNFTNLLKALLRVKLSSFKVSPET